MHEESIRSPVIVLASTSPRRRELLAMLGCPFEVVAPDVPEEAEPGISEPGEMVERLAYRKAAAVGARYPGRIVVAADTVVVVDGDILGKPQDEAEAVAMLQRLSGRWHSVYTGVAVRDPHTSAIRTRHSVTRVRFRDLRPAQIHRYVATGEPMDKAGAYGIQGRGSLLVAEIEGCYFNVVGLPVAVLAEMLEESGVFLL